MFGVADVWASGPQQGFLPALPAQQPEKPPVDLTKTKAAAGYDKGMAVTCPERPKGKNLTPKSDCNQCHKAAVCVAWAA